MERRGWALRLLRSHVFTLSNLYFRDHLKGIICWKRVNTRDELWRLFEAAVAMVKYMPEVFELAGNSLLRRTELSIRTNGKHF
jgi:hypothetical protein